MIDLLLKRLVLLTEKSRFEKIKKTILTAEPNIKGQLFELYVKYLYEKNGFKIEHVGGSGDLGADLIVYHSTQPEKVIKIIQAKNFLSPLEYNDFAGDIHKYETFLKHQYGSPSYEILSTSGFANISDEKLNCLNNLFELSDFDSLYDLIKNSKKYTRPILNLLPHNEKALRNIRRIWVNSNYACCIQATGTGKSYIICKTLQDQDLKSKLVIAPSNLILSQLRNLCRNYINEQNVEYVTYQKVLVDKTFKEKKYEVVILDEFHRVGAEKWGDAVKQIIHFTPDAKILGLTATHIRFLDGYRDMAEELFDNNIASEISLAKAILRDILPTPKYISAIYTLEDELDKLRARINKEVKNYNDKMEMFALLKIVQLNWERACGVDRIFEKYLSSSQNYKFAVFCESIDHLEVMFYEVGKWFKKSKIAKLINSYIVNSRQTDTENEKQVRLFSKKRKINGTVDLIFSVNMFNEGIHIREINGVIFLRATMSPIILYQQLGRCLHVGSVTPIVFDLVNNIKMVEFNSLQDSYNEELKKENYHRRMLGMEEQCPSFQVIDESNDARELINNTTIRRLSWEINYKKLETFYKKNRKYPFGIFQNSLRKWVLSQQQKIQKGNIDPHKFSLLEKLDFPMTKDELLWHIELVKMTLNGPISKLVEQRCTAHKEILVHYGPNERRFVECILWASEQLLLISLGKLNKRQMNVLNGIEVIDFLKTFFIENLYSKQERSYILNSAKSSLTANTVIKILENSKSCNLIIPSELSKDLVNKRIENRMRKYGHHFHGKKMRCDIGIQKSELEKRMDMHTLIGKSIYVPYPSNSEKQYNPAKSFTQTSQGNDNKKNDWYLHIQKGGTLAHDEGPGEDKKKNILQILYKKLIHKWH